MTMTATETEWCNFCGEMPKGALHHWGQHSMVNYHEKPETTS